MLYTIWIRVSTRCTGEGEVCYSVFGRAADQVMPRYWSLSLEALLYFQNFIVIVDHGFDAIFVIAVGQALQHGELLHSTGCFIGSARSQRVEYIGDCADSGFDRNFFAFEHSGIAAAVDRFMMIFGDIAQDIHMTYRAKIKIFENSVDNFPTFFRMGFHDFKFVLIQFAGFAQYTVRYANFADIVQR